MKELEDKFPQEQVDVLPYEQAKKVYYPEYEYSAGKGLTAFKAFDDFLHSVKKIPDGLAIYSGNAIATMGGKPKKIGTEIMKNAYRNINLANEDYIKTGITISPEDYNSWTYQGVAGATNFAAMIGLGMINPSLSYGYAGASSLAQTAEDGASKYVLDKDDEYFKEFDHTQEFAYGTVKAIGNVAIEKYLGGVGKQISMVKKAGSQLVKEGFKAGTKQTLKEVGKSVLKGGVAESSTEFLQSGTDTYFDYLLDRFENKKEAKDAFWGNMKGWVVAGLLGGGFGGAGTVYYRPKMIEVAKTELKGVVPEKDLNDVATAIVDKQADSFRDKLAIELTLSSELKAKHGDIYNQMNSTVVSAMKESGAYQDLSEAEFAQYASETSSKFADQALAESHKRNVWLEDVISDKDISYRGGQIRFFDKFEKNQEEAKNNIEKAIAQKKEKSVLDKLKAIGISPEFAKSFDIPQLMGWQDEKRGGGLFINRKNAINKEDSLVEFMAGEGLVNLDDPSAFDKSLDILQNLSIRDLNKKLEYNESDYESMLDNYIYDYAQALGYDISKMSFEEKEAIYHQMTANLSERADPNSIVEEAQMSDDDFNALTDGVFNQSDVNYIDNISQLKSGMDIEGFGVYREHNQERGFLFSTPSGNERVPYNYFLGQIMKGNIFEKPVASVKSSSGLGVYVKDAKKHFGTTNNLLEAGYILNDGSLLDLSGKKFGGEANTRSIDHREINEINVDMDEFINDGNIRYMPESDTILFVGTPNPKQISQINKIIKKADGNINIEVMKKAEDWGSDKTLYKEYSNIFDYKDIKRDITSFNNNNTSKAQLFRQGKKGSFDTKTKAIELTEKADLSTLPHELAHFWLDNMWDYARSGAASSDYMSNFQVVEKYLGVKNGQFRLTRNQHEKFARSYESYLLKGNLPNKVIGNMFDDYDKWLKRVYNDSRALNIELSEDIVEWFDTMTTGELLSPKTKSIVEKRVRYKKREDALNKNVEDAQNVVKEIETFTAPGKLTPVQSDYKTSYLTSVEKTTGEQVEAGVTNIKSEMKKANDIVANDLERAKRIAEGKETTDEVLTNAVSIAYDRFLKNTGQSEARAENLINQGLMLRRAGQEISSQREAYEKGAVNTPQYWNAKVVADKSQIIAEKKGLTQKELSKKISDATKDIVDNMPDTGKTEFVNKKIKELSDDLGLLYQKDKLLKYESETVSYNEIYRIVNQQLGTTLTKSEANEIVRLADDMLLDLEKSSNGKGNPSVAYFEKYANMEQYANSLAPSEGMRILTSVVGRGNLLASIKSPLTNILSNTTFGGVKALSRRIVNGTVENGVKKQAIDDFKEYTADIFRRTGYTFATMTPETIGMKTLGEKITHSEGEGWIRRVGRAYQDTVYKWGLGWGDLVAKNFAFIDYSTLMATKFANNEGLTPTELFEDITLLEPKTETGKRIREDAINEALIATYQKETVASEGGLKVRTGIGRVFEAAGLKGFGEIALPFVMTPSNVALYGLESGFGGILGIGRETANTIRTGKLNKAEKRNIELIVANGLGLVLSLAIASFIDDENYMPPYSLADAKTRQLSSKLGIPFNSVKIGNSWYSLDYLSVLGVPLVGVLNAKKEEGIINKIFAYAKSGLLQATNLPFIGGVSDLQKNLESFIGKSGEEAVEKGFTELLEFSYSRSVPSIISDVAKVIDPYEREKTPIATQVPYFRNQEEAKYDYTTGRKQKGSNAVFELLAGSRAKDAISNPVARELRRLNLAEETPSLTTVTRRGLLSTVKNKEQVEREFASMYSSGVKNLISSSNYKRMADEDKKDAINKIRSKAVKTLKNKYLKK